MQKGLLAFAARLGLGQVPRMNSQTNGQTLRKGAAFGLPGHGGKRFDYLTIDTADHYLFSAHLGAWQTYIIDLRTNKLVATIADTPGIEGIDYVPNEEVRAR